MSYSEEWQSCHETRTYQIKINGVPELELFRSNSMVKISPNLVVVEIARHRNLDDKSWKLSKATVYGSVVSYKGIRPLAYSDRQNYYNLMGMPHWLMVLVIKAMSWEES